MIIALLIVFGLALGSFVNALVWRVHEQSVQLRKKKKDPAYLEKLSITKGRSMCVHCKHELGARDLVPLLSWLVQRGKCRYCAKPIPIQYPLVEATTAVLFVFSYLHWPLASATGSWSAAEIVSFSLWLIILTGLMALLVYDLRWYLLPNKIVYPLTLIGVIYAVIDITTSNNHPFKALINHLLAVAVGGGIFYVLFQISSGKWIGGGDVKLGWLLGLIVGTPGKSMLLIFMAAILGSLASIPLLASHRLKRNSTIPFGPFLITAAIIVVLFGQELLSWYQRLFFPYTL